MSGPSKNGLRDMRPSTHSQTDARSSCHADCLYFISQRDSEADLPHKRSTAFDSGSAPVLCSPSNSTVRTDAFVHLCEAFDSLLGLHTVLFYTSAFGFRQTILT